MAVKNPYKIFEVSDVINLIFLFSCSKLISFLSCCAVPHVATLWTCSLRSKEAPPRGTKNRFAILVTSKQQVYFEVIEPLLGSIQTPLRGIEPRSRPPQGRILSVKLWGLIMCEVKRLLNLCRKYQNSD